MSPAAAKTAVDAEMLRGRKRPKLDKALSNVSVEMLEDHFHLPLRDAAKAFGVCITFFKKMCRARGIKRWPHRKVAQIHKLHEKIGEGAPEISVEALADLRKREEDASIGGDGERVPVWDKVKQRRLAGMAAPLRRRLELYLWEHPDYEVYNGQDGKDSDACPYNGASTRLSARVQSQAKRQKLEHRSSNASSAVESEVEVEQLSVPADSDSTLNGSSSECEAESWAPLASGVHESEAALEAESLGTIQQEQATECTTEWFQDPIDKLIPLDEQWDLSSGDTPQQAQAQSKGEADFLDKLDDHEFSQFVDAIGNEWATRAV